MKKFYKEVMKAEKEKENRIFKEEVRKNVDSIKNQIMIQAKEGDNFRMILVDIKNKEIRNEVEKIFGKCFRIEKNNLPETKFYIMW